MIRLSAAILTFIVLVVIQVSFVQSLPYPFSATPILFVFAIFLYQYVSLNQAIWWILFGGFFFDLLGIGTIPLETFAYGASAFVMSLCARHLFSNRSYYGLAATTLLGLATLTLVEIVIMMLLNIFTAPVLIPQDLLFGRLWGMLLALPMLLILFPLADPIRRMIRLLMNP